MSDYTKVFRAILGGRFTKAEAESLIKEINLRIKAQAAPLQEKEKQ